MNVTESVTGSVTGSVTESVTESVTPSIPSSLSISSSTSHGLYEHLQEYLQGYIPALVVVIILCVCVYVRFGQTDIIDFNDIDMYYINLDRAHKRRTVFENQCKEQGLRVTRFPAVDARRIPNEAVAKVLKHPKSQNFLKSVLVNNRKNIGHFGCYLSHVAIYHEFMKSDKEYCIIFEDDAEFKTSSFQRDANTHMANVPKDWDIVLFGFHTADDLHHGKNQDTFLQDNIFHKLEHFTGLHAYMINKRSCAKLLQKVMNPVWYLDWEIANLTKAGHFKVYGVFEPLVCQPACYTLKFDNKHFFMHHMLDCKWGGGMATTFSE